MRLLLLSIILSPFTLISQSHDSLYFQSYLKNGSFSIITPSEQNLALDTNTVVAYINGVWHTYYNAVSAASRIADSSAHNILLCYASCDKKNRRGIELAKSLWIRYYPNYKDALIEKLADTIVSSVSAGNKFILIAHSKGGAIAYRTQLVILKKMQKHNCHVDSLQNLKIITLGGLSPAANKWDTAFNITTVANNGDWVPHAGGNHEAHFSFRYKKFRLAHRLGTYLQRIKFGHNL